MWLDDQRTALYRFFDEGGALLYVGITANTKERWLAHRYDKPWWPDVAEKTVEWFDNRTLALEAEKHAIVAELPAYNRLGSPLNPGPRELDANEVTLGQAKELLRGIELGAALVEPTFIVGRRMTRDRIVVLLPMDFYERALVALGEERVLDVKPASA